MAVDFWAELDKMNGPQKEAVLHGEGPMMIIAGAGSGKTRVLTYRIAWLLHEDNDLRLEAFNVLALTFTNKAAKEMRERIGHLIGSDARNLWMGTFHSIFAKILRFEADKIGYTPDFTIYDTDDAKSLLSTIVKEMQLDDKLYKSSNILHRISNAKNSLVTWQQYAQDKEMRYEDEAAGRPRMAEIFKEYSLRCRRANAMDFDDLLLNTHELFRLHADVLNKYQHKFKTVLVDEFQDTNTLQYAIIRKLAAVWENVCVVGDDAQSIYAFRGATIQNILNFQKDYGEYENRQSGQKGVKVVKLEQNYRSTQTIVGAANSVIRYNRDQLPKNVWTQNDDGAPIEVIRAASDAEEARIIASSLFEAKMQHSMANKDFAILYRTNSQSRALEESLRKLNIRYKIVGGMSFYQRKEIKDMVAYLRFVINTSDEEALKRIINYPKRGIGDTSVEKIIATVQQQAGAVSLWDVILNIRQYFTGRTAVLIEGFRDLILSCQREVAHKDAFEAATYVAKHSGMLKELYEDKTVEGKVRYDNLQELLNAVKAFVDNPENEDKKLSTFLQQVSLLTSADEDKSEDSVTLMTVHGSKGLEFPYVFIAGLEENLFPSQMMESRADLEEERRLFYVAITRAKERLYLSYALQRYRYGKLVPGEPSRFLSEIDSTFLRNARSNFHQIEASSPATKSGFTRYTPPKSGFQPKPAAEMPDDFVAASPRDLAEGQTVRHPKFGRGKILEIEAYGGDRRARIHFEQFGDKTLILSFAKLMIL